MKFRETNSPVYRSEFVNVHNRRMSVMQRTILKTVKRKIARITG